MKTLNKFDSSLRHELPFGSLSALGTETQPKGTGTLLISELINPE